MSAARLLLAACFIGSVVANTTLLAGDWLRVDQPTTPGMATLIYDPGTGELNVNGGGRALTSYELVSHARGFVSENYNRELWCMRVISPACDSHKFLELSPDGSGADFPPGLSLGVGVYPTGLNWEEVAADLSASGSFLGQPTAMTSALYVVPEPSGMCLALAAGIGVLLIRRSRWKRIATVKLHNRCWIVPIIACAVLAASSACAGEWLRVDQPSTTGLATLIYDSTTGELNINGGGRGLTTYELSSKGWLFDPEIAAIIYSCSHWIAGCGGKIFHLDASGFGAEFPPGHSLGVGIYPTDLEWNEVAADLTADGSFKDVLREITQHGLYVVPEPSGLCVMLASAACLAMRRGQRRSSTQEL